MIPVDRFVDDLAKTVGVDHVLVAADLRREYETDWTGRFAGTARGVVRPATAGEVIAVLRLCANAGVAVTVQGGKGVSTAAPATGIEITAAGRAGTAESAARGSRPRGNGRTSRVRADVARRARMPSAPT